jgi:hypothetical protein
MGPVKKKVAALIFSFPLVATKSEMTAASVNSMYKPQASIT